ncbi:MAG TPA: hypothetical protein VFY90_10070 [Tepidiformaceae bacterium]|nr:hypothetical protein [Tepidiformaceae bacterium]
MRALILVALVVATLGVASKVTSTRAGGVGPADLADAGWTCFQPPPDFNPYIHCAPPGQLEGITSGEARSGMFVTFETTDINADSAPLLGTERMIRGDLYHGQPCPTDPPTYEYGWLYPRFGWDYYICHTFDSPW